MITKTYSKFRKETFARLREKNKEIKKEKNNGLDYRDYYIELMEESSGMPFNELITKPISTYIKAEKKLELTGIKLEYELQKGYAYNYNYNKYVKPHVLENGEVDPKFLKEKVEEIRNMQQVKDRLQEQLINYTWDEEGEFVERPEWVQYFENINYIYVNEQSKWIVALHQQITDAADLVMFRLYNPNYVQYNEKYNCKDIELNFLVNQKVKKSVEKMGGVYPIPDGKFTEIMYGKRKGALKSQIYLINKNDASIGSRQYFLEQLQKIEDEAVKEMLCEYSFDFGVSVVNPYMTMSAAFFGLAAVKHDYVYEMVL